MSILVAAQGARRAPSQSTWFLEFLREELAPYPGRAGTVARMTVAATVVMIICLAFRVPYGFQGAIYALIVSRENLRATLESAGTILLVSGVAAAYILISATLVISNPTLHFLWNIFSFLAAFYTLSILTNYGAASTFAIVIAIGIPFWDRHVSAETNVDDTLWLMLATLIGVVVTAAVELAFVRMRPGADIVLPIAERLAAVQSLLACYIEDRPVDHATEKKINRLVMLGTSRLWSALSRSEYSPNYRAQMGGVVALVSSLVDIAANASQHSFGSSKNYQKELRDLAAAVASIRGDLM